MRILLFVLTSIFSSFLIADILLSATRFGLLKLLTGIVFVLVGVYVYDIELSLGNILLLIFAGHLSAELWIMYKLRKIKQSKGDL